MNEFQPFGASATASTRSAAIRKPRWLPRIGRVGFWRALVEFTLVYGLASLFSYVFIWYVGYGWGFVVGVATSIIHPLYAWRLSAGTGRRRTRIARVLAWITLVSVLQGLIQLVLLALTPSSITVFGQPLNDPNIARWQSFLLTVMMLIVFFVPLRAFVDLVAASRSQLRWRLTLSYMLIGLITTIMIPIGIVILVALFGVLYLPSLPQAFMTPQDAARALTPLVRQNAPQADLQATLQGLIDGSARIPTPPVDANTPAPSAEPLSMSLTDVQRLILLRPDRTVLAGVGPDIPAAGTQLGDATMTQIGALAAQVQAGGCREGMPSNGLLPDRAVCAITNDQGQPIALLVAETTAPPVPDVGGLEPSQALVLIGISVLVIVALTPLTMLIILPIAGGGLGYVLAGRITKRLQRLTAAAGDIAAGNLERRVEIDSEDEVGRLATDFNTMAAKLAEREHALADAAQRAEALLRANKRLVADVSHELRTPLTTVRGYLEALAHEHGNKLPQRDLQVIDGEMQRLTHLIEDLFTLARTEAQQLPLHIQPTDACALANKLVDALAPLARREREIEVIAALPDTLPPVCADRTRLEQVLQNLIQNALRYTPAGGIVALEATATADHVTLAVADTGMGIAPEELERVWERFYRSDRSRARETGGAGLGLALVKELVTAMGGTVGAESTLGRGSKFSITLRQADGDTGKG